MFVKVLAWMIQNVSKSIAIMTAIFSLIIAPLWWGAWAFFIETRLANADVKILKVQNQKLEQAVYRTDGKIEEVLKAVGRIESSRSDDLLKTLKILREARQLRQAEKN